MSTSYPTNPKLLWEPQPGGLTAVDNLRRRINRQHGLNLRDYADLHKYSVEDYTFWLDLWYYLRIIYSQAPTKILEPGKLDISPTWFPGARLNYAENLLHGYNDAVACTAVTERNGDVVHHTYRELRALVRDLAAAMRANGIRVGDRIAAVVANNIHAVVIALAASSLGAIFSLAAPDMGTQGILDRYRQIRPKLFFAESHVQYAGKVIDQMPKVREVVADLLNYGLEGAIVLPSNITGQDAPVFGMLKTRTLSAFLASGDGRPLAFEQLPFNHPLVILYSSGTTGPPKCIVHSAGGVLLQTKKETTLGFSASPDDVYFQYTTTGWMMWTHMLSGLSVGARVILYDGSPFHPDVKTFLKFISDQGVSVWGTSPRFLTEIASRGIDPLKLAVIHLIDEHEHQETSCKALGMKVEVFDPHGNNIEHTGEPGEMVCTRPHPSLPLYFWGDEDGKKYRSAYFEMYPGIWRQGDFMVINPVTKGILMLGRSDGVLNPSGVRFGSGEIYTVLEKFQQYIEESICVGQRRPSDKDERVLLFLKMRQGYPLTKSLDEEIRTAIRSSLSARHVPSYIFAVDDIPLTINGKKIEIAVKQVVSGIDVKPSGMVANPESLELYYRYRDIEGLVGTTKAKL
ncbi:hypothetical protein PLEOSDRAFT_1064819 [Pleurotus ostreatus PC15]|uniref:AMP-dependent synthetase/ligase domain-containing protein n=1 Tax=Pleurotus ostreatus (strain PC15) TaxID=1137138 RepID=A0A067NV45_PLEO1|nr:hypothetical protein PLEOSDRAFT_1064819 [Pleurotus ostreatus PC15]